MLKIDYHVTAHGVIERGNFYNYMHNKGYTDHKLLDREIIVNSSYPFGVCIKKKELLIIESATINFLTQKAGRMKTVEEFKKIIEKGDNDYE